MGEERRLTGGTQRDVRERDGVVFRSPGPQSTAVLALLRHLEACRFAASPRVHGSGFAPDGRETLVYVDGRNQHPDPWSDGAVVRLGELVRELHDIASTFVPPPGACWKPSYLRHLGGDDPVIGHGDLGPWNVLAREGMPVAIIDWDHAGPVDRLWDLAHAAWLNVQLHDDDVAADKGLPDAAGRARQLRLFLDAYRLPLRQREDFVDRIAELAVHDAANEAVEGCVTASSTDAVAPDGFPVMWAIAWRARSASWILRNRAVLQREILAGST